MTLHKVYIVLLFAVLLRYTSCIDTITTIAGSSTSGSFSGDNVAATSATLNFPTGLSVDSSGFPFTFDGIYYYYYYIKLIALSH